MKALGREAGWAGSGMPSAASMSQHCVLGAEDQPRRGLETGQVGGVAMLSDPTLPSAAHTQPLLSPWSTADIQ